jgi:hypothetical protein
LVSIIKASEHNYEVCQLKAQRFYSLSTYG